ncbi:MAG: MoxR family ATPase [Gammaproteobacteria bacterium]|nr:MoxR family ATPase [Gammaproteobacteria bacterium]
MKFIDNNANQRLKQHQEQGGSLHHAFEEPDIKAINAALATGRPLLLKGEPGIGKTQMAKAAALVLERPLLPMVVDSRTEARDLLWTFDAVERLAEAQILGHIEKDRDKARKALDISNFINPGPFWWALHWTDAKSKNKDQDPPGFDPQTCKPQNGCVILIDEIDKAESDVPNGLLEVLAEHQFTAPLGSGLRVELTDRPAPLVMITTNEERDLPAAFTRRCLVRHITMPGNEQKFKDKLIERGQIHFGAELQDDVYQKAADLVYTERQRCKEKMLKPLPGQAEYLDLLRAANELKDHHLDALDAIQQVQEYVIVKHTEDRD